ncbi:MAG: phospholipid carrier-dependent glycosyltransferase [Anaerolineae bacterium]|nr:phospholipid carrier-dependent glycosyltransferase [Anaerolineae bacterium]
MNTSPPHPIYRRLLIALLIAFMLLAGMHSIVTPLFEASDELWHYPMVKTLADGNGLPIQEPANPGPWRQEGSQPPLYYALGALTTFWIDTNDMDEVRRLNPHADNGIVTEDHNNNIVVHNAAKEAWPWQGATLAVHLVRFLSVLLSTGTVYFTYRIGQEVFPDKPWLALAGAAVAAFTPMFAFISGSINNDNLAVLLATAAVWLVLRIVRLANANQPTLRWAIVLGTVLGMAALSKQSTLGLFGLAGLGMAYAAWRQRRWQTFFIEGPIIIGLAAAIAGWWYWRNWQLYGDLTGLNVFLDIVGRRSPPASLVQLWGERGAFMASYWGLFGGVSVPMASWVYTILNALAILSIPGIILTLALKARKKENTLAGWMPALLTLLWIPCVAVPLATGWTRYTLASQGRLVFSAISVLSLWFVAGLCAWLPERWGKLVGGLITASMAVLAFSAPFAWIAPHYSVDYQPDLFASGPSLDFTPPGTETPALRLLGSELETSETTPGGKVRLTLYWESLSPMDQDWSVFVHLQDSTGLIAAQRDTYPGLGLIATTDLEPGLRWADTYVVPIGDTAYAPETLDVYTGVYHLESGQRMLLPDGSDRLKLGRVSLLANRGDDDVPNPITVNFSNELELIGYSVDTRLVSPGDTAAFTLYWRVSSRLDRNYTGSVQIFDSEFGKYGQWDDWLMDGSDQTSNWQPGKIVQNDWLVPLSTNTPPGVYNIQLIVYWTDEEDSIHRLQRITNNGNLTDDFLPLTRIRVQP